MEEERELLNLVAGNLPKDVSEIIQISEKVREMLGPEKVFFQSLDPEDYNTLMEYPATGRSF